MAAISDSSPLILFGAIGRLDLLQSVFMEVVIPPAVRREVIVAGSGRPGALEAEASGWIKVREPQRLFSGTEPFGALGRGEAEAIALALELAWDEPILLDDLAGRRLAEHQGLLVIGSGGALVRAKDQGLIPAVAPLLDRLRESGLYLSEAVYDRLLALAEELPQDRR